MSTVHLHLKNLPPDAVNLDIRRFFIDFDIPEGGVQIVGGPDGEAFVTFRSYEDLLKATSYAKKPFLGRHLLINLVSSVEIEKIIDTIKYQLGANIIPRAMEMSPPRQMSPPGRMSPPRHMSPPRQISPRKEYAWARSPVRDFSPPREMSRGASASADLQWPKRPRAVTPPWSRDDSIFEGIGSLESKRMRLSDQGLGSRRYPDDSGQERETLRIELEKEKQRNQDIEDELRRNRERIERLERGIVEKDIHTMVRESARPDPHDDWDCRRREDSRSPQDFRPIEEPARFDRFDRPEPRYEPSLPRERYVGPDDVYDRNDAGYLDCSPVRPIMDDRRDRSPIRSRERRRSRSPPRRPEPPMAYSPPGYIMMSNLDPVVTYKEVRRFFDGYVIARGGILLKSVDRNNTIAYIKFINLDDALDSDKMAGHLLHGREVQIEMISPVDYDAQRSSEDVQEKRIFSPPTKPKPMSRDKVGYDGPVGDVRKLSQYPPPKEQRTEVIDGIKVALPYTGTVKQTLYFVGLKFLPEDATACSVWEEFGGSLGRSIGVLMLVEEGDKPDKTWYVAFENFENRNAEIPLHDKARAIKDKSVYRKMANASNESKIFISTRNGEDKEISQGERAMLKQRFLLKQYEKLQKGKTVRDFEEEQLLINKISRTLFKMKQVQSFREPKVSDQSHAYYLRLIRLPPDATACEVKSWFKDHGKVCLGVTMTSKPDEELGKFKTAYVAFDNHKSRNIAREKYSLSRGMTERAVLRFLARQSFFPDVEIFKATNKGVDEVLGEKERQVLQKEWFPDGIDVRAPGTEDPEKPVARAPPAQKSKEANEPLYILQIKKVKPDMSCSDVWKWFGGREGPAEGVTLMETDGSCIAFVAFHDKGNCMDAMKDRQYAEIITENQMLYKIANSRDNHMVFRSSRKGPNGMMKKAEKAELKERIIREGRESYRPAEQKTSGSSNAANSHPEGNQSGKLYLRIFNLAEDATACEVWSWFNGPTGPSPGVTLVQKLVESGDIKYAFVEFTDPTIRNEEKLKYPSSRVANERQVLRTLALCGPEAEIFQSTESGVDRALTVEERETITTTMFPDGIPPKGVPISGAQQATGNLPKLLLRDGKYEYMRLTTLKPAISAYMLNSQYRPCRGVTLVKNAFGQAVLAFVAFNKKTNSRAVTWQNSRDRELAYLDDDFEIYENTSKPKDRKITQSERQQLIDYVRALDEKQGRKGQVQRK